MVQVTVHLEPAAEGGIRWWAESGDRPGFSAVAGSLEELRYRTIEALREIEAEAGRDALQLDVEFHLAQDFASSESLVVSPAPAAEPGAHSRSTALLLQPA